MPKDSSNTRPILAQYSPNIRSKNPVSSTCNYTIKSQLCEAGRARRRAQLEVLDELTDEYAIFSVWPTEQDRIAATHLMGVPDLKWAKVEGGQHYMDRAQYDLCNDQL